MKNQYLRGRLPKKGVGLGQFGDLMRMVFFRRGTFDTSHYDNNAPPPATVLRGWCDNEPGFGLIVDIEICYYIIIIVLLLLSLFYNHIIVFVTLQNKIFYQQILWKMWPGKKKESKEAIMLIWTNFCSFEIKYCVNNFISQ